MDNNTLDQHLRNAPDITPPDGLNRRALQNFDSYQRAVKSKRTRWFNWYIPSAAGLASLSFGMIAGAATAPATASLSPVEADDIIAVGAWQGDSWLLESLDNDG